MKLELGNYEMEMVYHDPLIFTLKGVLSDEECKHFIDLAAGNMERSRVSGFDDQGLRKDGSLLYQR